MNELDAWTTTTRLSNWYDTGDEGLINLATVEIIDKTNVACRLVLVSGHEKLIDLSHYDKIKEYLGY